MQRSPSSKRWCPLLVWAACFLSVGQLQAQPQFTEGPIASLLPDSPLAGLLQFSTDVPARVSYDLRGPGEVWRVQSNEFLTNHALPILGLAPDAEYVIERLTLQSEDASQYRPEIALTVVTESLPADFPALEVRTNVAAQMEPGLTLLSARFRGNDHLNLTMALDEEGTVRWYVPRAVRDIRRMGDGSYLGHDAESGTIVTLDALGNLTQSWHSQQTNAPPAGSVAVATERFHHDVFPMPNGNLLTLSSATRTIDNFPTSYTDPNAPTETASVRDDIIVEFSPDGTIVSQWSLVDMLNPTRIGYDSLNGSRNDWAHANSVFYDPSDDAIVVSIRHQDAVVKFSRASGELLWILANHEDWGPELEPRLLEPIGDDFRWQYHQHAAKVLPNGNLLLHDNGNHRATPTDPPLESAENNTRAVEFAIDEQSMTVSQVWEYGDNADEVLYSPTRGDADWLAETGNRLITYANLLFVDGVGLDASQGRLLEVDQAGEKVFDLTVRLPGVDAWVYRSERIPSLYPPEYTVIALPFLESDFTGDLLVDGADLAVWQSHFGTQTQATRTSGDANGDGYVTGADFVIWQREYGYGVGGTQIAVPEPSSVALLAISLAGWLALSAGWRRAVG